MQAELETGFLPEDVLVRIFNCIDEIQDFVAFSGTSRLLHKTSTSTTRLRYVKTSLSYGKSPVPTGSTTLSAYEALSRLRVHERAWRSPEQAMCHDVSSSTSLYQSALSGEYLYDGGWDYTGTEFQLDRFHLLDGRMDFAWFKHQTNTTFEHTSQYNLPQFIIDESQDLLICIAMNEPESSAYVEFAFWCYSLSARDLHPSQRPSTMIAYLIPQAPTDISVCGGCISVSYGVEMPKKKPEEGVIVIDWQTGAVLLGDSPREEFSERIYGISIQSRFLSPSLVLHIATAYSKHFDLTSLSQSAVCSFALPPLHEYFAYTGTSFSTLGRSLVLQNYSEDPRVLDDGIVAFSLLTRHDDSYVPVSSVFVVDRRGLLRYVQDRGAELFGRDGPIAFEEWSSHVPTHLVRLSPEAQHLPKLAVVGRRLGLITQGTSDISVQIYDFSPYHGAEPTTATDEFAPLSDAEEAPFVRVPEKKKLLFHLSPSTTIRSRNAVGYVVHVGEKEIVHIQAGVEGGSLVQVIRFY